jgi:glycosyltransferase involved in cell wall biosynthesis
LPAFVEHQRRRILEAVANGIPLIATKACGIENVENVENVETIETGNAAQLKEKIEEILLKI